MFSINGRFGFENGFWQKAINTGMPQNWFWRLPESSSHASLWLRELYALTKGSSLFSVE